MKRQNPSTSLDAYKALTPEKIRSDYSKIVECLKVIGSGTYEMIANHLQWNDINKCARRLKEMEGLELIWKPGAKKLTKRNRQAYVYQLTGNFAKTENELPPELTKSTPTASIQPQQHDNGFKQGSIMFLD